MQNLQGSFLQFLSFAEGTTSEHENSTQRETHRETDEAIAIGEIADLLRTGCLKIEIENAIQ